MAKEEGECGREKGGEAEEISKRQMRKGLAGLARKLELYALSYGKALKEFHSK